MINENDCFDCDHSIKENLFKPDSKWICEVTGEPIPNDGTHEEACKNFKYPV